MAVKKRTGELDWEDLRHFVALAGAGSLSAAARALGVNHATVARRAAQLEARLGRQLFRRGAGGYSLSPDGEAVLAEARAMERAALAIAARSEAGALHGLVRLATTRSLAEGFLVPRLGGLRRAHPDIDLEVLVELRVMSLARHEADLAIRLGRPRDSELVGRRVATMRSAFHGARPAGRLLIGYDLESDFIPEARWLNATFPSTRFVLRSNSQAVQLEAARAGLGLALLPHYLVAGDRRLKRVDLGVAPPDREVWLLTRRDARRTPRVQAVADHVAATFAAGWPAG